MENAFPMLTNECACKRRNGVLSSSWHFTESVIRTNFMLHFSESQFNQCLLHKILMTKGTTAINEPANGKSILPLLNTFLLLLQHQKHNLTQCAPAFGTTLMKCAICMWIPKSNFNLIFERAFRIQIKKHFLFLSSNGTCFESDRRKRRRCFESGRFMYRNKKKSQRIAQPRNTNCWIHESSKLSTKYENAPSLTQFQVPVYKTKYRVIKPRTILESLIFTAHKDLELKSGNIIEAIEQSIYFLITTECSILWLISLLFISKVTQRSFHVVETEKFYGLEVSASIQT